MKIYFDFEFILNSILLTQKLIDAKNHILLNNLQEAKPYSFSYGVQDEYEGLNYAHNEDSNGESLQGSYTVDLPDGTRKIVCISLYFSENLISLHYKNPFRKYCFSVYFVKNWVNPIHEIRIRLTILIYYNRLSYSNSC